MLKWLAKKTIIKLPIYNIKLLTIVWSEHIIIVIAITTIHIFCLTNFLAGI